MKFLAFALIAFSVAAFAKSDQEMVDALNANPYLTARGIEKSDIRRGMKIASAVVDRALKNECSVYLEGFAIFENEDNCGDNLRLATGDIKDLFPPGNKETKNISISLDTDMDGDGYGDLVSRFVQNAFYNFVPKAAEAQDYNSFRSNRMQTSRSAIISGAMEVLNIHEEELVEVFKGNSTGERLLRSLAERMESLESDPKFALVLYKEFIASLQSIHLNELKAKKSANIEQSEALYSQIARRAGLPEDVIREILKSATLITQKEIANGGAVEFPEFGLIAVDLGEVRVDQTSRIGRNPQTGKEIKIAVKKVSKLTKVDAGNALNSF